VLWSFFYGKKKGRKGGGPFSFLRICFLAEGRRGKKEGAKGLQHVTLSRQSLSVISKGGFSSPRACGVPEQRPWGAGQEPGERREGEEIVFSVVFDFVRKGACCRSRLRGRKGKVSHLGVRRTVELYRLCLEEGGERGRKGPGWGLSFNGG